MKFEPGWFDLESGITDVDRYRRSGNPSERLGTSCQSIRSSLLELDVEFVQVSGSNLSAGV